MRFSFLLPLLAAAATAEAAVQGFNYGSTFTNGQAKVQADYEADFKRAQTLQGTSGFNSARLYTMIQGGTANTPTDAIPAAINTKTGLLLGLWASGGQDVFNNELAALSSAIHQYGTAFTDLIQGISVGSEDLYRITPTGIENKSGVGAGPAILVNYINQLRSTLSGTPAAGKSVGHVDTWTAWTNSSNNAVIAAVDWLGFDGYPYFQTVNENSIDNAQSLFQQSVDATIAAAQGKEVWITETGWPVSGPQENQAVASTDNAKRYWDEVGCALFGKTNTWWFTLQDSAPTTPSPSFGLVGSDLNSAPLFDLSCSASSSPSSSSSSSSAAESSTLPVSTTVASATAPGSTAASVTASVIDTPVGAPSAPASQSDVSTEIVTSTITVTTLLPLESCFAACSNSPTTTLVAGSTVAVATSTAASSCPTNLNGDYQYPHLIVPVDSSKPDVALGTSYNGTLSSTVSTLFNFDIPSSYAGKTCSLVFLFPQLSQLETSSYTFNGKGGISVSQLTAVATQQTTYDTVPSAASTKLTPVESLQAGNSYVISSAACPAGNAVTFEFSSTGGLELNFFQDYNPSPLGAYITSC